MYIKKSISIAFVLLIYTNCMGQIDHLNLDFEEWIDSTMVSTSWGDEPNYNILDKEWGEIQKWTPWGNSILRTTDATSGEYAIVFNDWYFYAEAHLALGENKDGPLYPYKCEGCGLPIDFRPEKLVGDYKVNSLSSEIDSLRGYVELYLTKYDSIDQKRDTIGNAFISLDETGLDYEEFHLPITYHQADIIPDTLILILSMKRFSPHWQGEQPSSGECLFCSYVFFDNLKFDKLTSIEQVSEESIENSSFSFYPNPSSTSLFIKNRLSQDNKIVLLNNMGQIIGDYTIKSKGYINIDLSDKSSGLYFLSNKFNTYKVVIH